MFWTIKNCTIYVLSTVEADSFHNCPQPAAGLKQAAILLDSNQKVLYGYGVTQAAWWKQLISSSTQIVHITLVCAPRCEPSGTCSREVACDRARESGKHTVIRNRALELIDFTLQAKEIKFQSQTWAGLGTSERCVLQRWNDGQQSQSPTSFLRTGIDALPGNFTPSISRSRAHLQQPGTYIGKIKIKIKKINYT